MVPHTLTNVHNKIGRRPMNSDQIEDVLAVRTILTEGGSVAEVIARLIDWRDGTVHVHAAVVQQDHSVAEDAAARAEVKASAPAKAPPAKAPAKAAGKGRAKPPPPPVDDDDGPSPDPSDDADF